MLMTIKNQKQLSESINTSFENLTADFGGPYLSGRGDCQTLEIKDSTKSQISCLLKIYQLKSIYLTSYIDINSLTQ